MYSVFLILGTLILGPLASDALAFENLEKTEKEIELEKEEELFSSLSYVVLERQEVLYQVITHPELQLVDYTVYLSTETRPPRV